MRAMKIVCMILLGGMLTLSATGCGRNKASDKATNPPEIQATANPTETPKIQETTSPTKAVESSTPPSSDTTISIVDMPGQIVIKEGEAQSGDKSPDAVPDEIPILDGANNKAAIKIGDGTSPDDPYYLVKFEMDDSVEKTIERYRQVLKDKGLDIASESDEDGMMHFTIDTKSWEAQMMIFTLLGKTAVWINYVKR
ncbi:hypothetical protein E0485_13800 [Paenibacillus albiflavus]|uniref:Uncharacterized protein n=1 Tax=Paenibacillus albiflavus TaxID=2545760 RepID=A0A4R4EBG4_9BACL|nr:hypothetical protein [Paenibacillus albiflavus]TCZ76657.1 hypothetical protein E0485_13800 [Paenibacillus albiflavus]